MLFSTTFWVVMLIYLYPSVRLHFLTRSSFSSSILILFYVSSLLTTELVSELPSSWSSCCDPSCYLTANIDFYFASVFGIGMSIFECFKDLFENFRPYDMDLSETLLYILDPDYLILGVLGDPSCAWGESKSNPDKCYFRIGWIGSLIFLTDNDFISGLGE